MSKLETLSTYIQFVDKNFKLVIHVLILME